MTRSSQEGRDSLLQPYQTAMAKLQLDNLDFRAEVSAIESQDPQYGTLLETAMVLAQSTPGVVTAGSDMLGSNNKPKMLQLTAWMLHTDIMNRNGTAFQKADIEAAITEGLFKAPYFGMIDFNHDFRSYGAWYEATLAFDPKAKQYGVLVKGAIFAWAYPELTDRLLAMQQRNGFIDVSMACIGSGYEEGTTADGGSVRWLRNPVFFTTSVLDVPPADPHAQGLGSEDPEQSSGDRETELMQRASLEENTMTDEATNDELLDVVPETAADEAPEEVTPEVPEVATESGPNDEDKPVNDQADTAALQNANETLKLALKAAETSLAEVVAERDALLAFKASVDAEMAKETELRIEAEKNAKRTARLADLPDTVRAEMETPEKAKLLDSWVAMDQAEWDVTKTLFEKAAAAGSKRSKVDASLEEGTLATGGESSRGGRAIDSWLGNRK